MSSKTSKEMKLDLFEVISKRILNRMYEGEIPWENPTTNAYSYVSGKPYSLINQILLGGKGQWLTYKQGAALGFKPVAGTKGTQVVFYKFSFMKDFITTEGRRVQNVRVPIMHYYFVFEQDKFEGLEKKETPVREFLNPKEVVDNYLKREDIRLVRSDKEYYSIEKDEISVLENYPTDEDFYYAIFRMMIFSTGIEKRLDRFMGYRFGVERYSREELVADIGAGYLASMAGIFREIPDKPTYIKEWSRRLRGDKRRFCYGATRAEKAINFILTGKLNRYGD